MAADNPEEATASVSEAVHSGGDEGSVNTQLRLAANEVRHGADEARERIIQAMSIGSPSIRDIAYAINSRVKEDFKIYNKVLKKRAEKRLDYNVGNLRDIIGLRIVTLYRLDALDIIPTLLSLINSDDNPRGKNVFEPGSIEEVVIYSTNPTGDAQALPERLNTLFETNGLGDITHVDQRPSNYSSIHLVCWCKGKYGDSLLRIPVEIQIRTAFEDAWGEIDHKLKYKSKDTKLRLSEERAIKTALKHLNVMKAFIDGAAQYADQIRIQRDEVHGLIQPPEHLRPFDNALTKIKALGSIPPQVMRLIEVAYEAQEEALHPDRSGNDFASDRIENLESAIKFFQDALKSCQDNKIEDEVVSYYLEMEIALSNYRLGRELKDNKYLGDAARDYSAIEKNYGGTAISHYRHGKVLGNLGDYQSAFSQIEKCIEKVSGTDDLPKDHWLRAAAPRILGLYHCLEAERILKQAREHSKVDEVIDAVKELYVKAIRITCSASEIQTEPNHLGEGAERLRNHSQIVANNVICYAVEYHKNGGDIADLTKVDVGKDRINQFAKTLEEAVGASPGDLAMLDSIAAWYHCVGDQEKAKQYAERVKETLAKGEPEDLDVSSEDFDVLARANEILGFE